MLLECKKTYGASSLTSKVTWEGIFCAQIMSFFCCVLHAMLCIHAHYQTLHNDWSLITNYYYYYYYWDFFSTSPSHSWKFRTHSRNRQHVLQTAIFLVKEDYINWLLLVAYFQRVKEINHLDDCLKGACTEINRDLSYLEDLAKKLTEIGQGMLEWCLLQEL